MHGEELQAWPFRAKKLTEGMNDPAVDGPAAPRPGGPGTTADPPAPSAGEPGPYDADRRLRASRTFAGSLVGQKGGSESRRKPA